MACISFKLIYIFCGSKARSRENHLFADSPLKKYINLAIYIYLKHTQIYLKNCKSTKKGGYRIAFW